MGRIAGVIIALLAVPGCDDVCNVLCPAWRRLDVGVVNDQTGAQICDATVTATDGAYVEQLVPGGCRYAGALGRPGTYSVRVERVTFRPQVVPESGRRGSAYNAVTQVMPQHIGIVACSAEGSSLCYRTICLEGAELLGAYDHPEVSMHTLPLAAYMRCIDRGDWQGVGELMLSSAQKLAQIGADFLICPVNTIHRALPYVEPRSPLPWLHIADVVAAQAVARGFRRLGLTGTRYLVESDVYPEQLAARGLEYVRPNAPEREEVNRIIMDELVHGVFKPEAVASLQRVIGRMKDEGCDAVVLGCTEIPLIMNDSNSPLPTLDSTRLLARAALRRAGQGPAQPA
jgi:aspartate racemase